MEGLMELLDPSYIADMKALNEALRCYYVGIGCGAGFGGVLFGIAKLVDAVSNALEMRRYAAREARRAQ